MNVTGAAQKVSAILLIYFISSVSGADTSTHREFLISPNSKKKIELIWAQPNGMGPWPTLILVHPHQEWPNKIGAEVFEKNDVISYWVKKGFLTAAVSQPGYGKSEGPSDFCGPETQNAVLQVVEHFRQQPFVKNDSIFLYGGSRGASVSAIVAAKDSHIAGAILKSGLYDFASAYQSYPLYSAIKLTMIWEIGWNNEAALKERSAINYADKIKVPLLVIHGTNDDRASMEYAKAFVKKVNESGGNAQFLPLESEHVIPMTKINPLLETFISKIMEGLNENP